MAVPIKSTFTLTFAVEIVGFDIFHDCNEGWIDLGPIQHGMRFQYQLFPAYSYDVDVAIWPHVAKVVCGQESCWVRIWQFLERRWLTFSISHALPIRVVEFQYFEIFINVNPGIGAIGSAAKGDLPTEVFIPPLKFRERRYFGQVETNAQQHEGTNLKQFIRKWIWNLVVDFIPASYLDGPFDTPSTVKDIRHQDAILDNVQDKVLNRLSVSDEELLRNVSSRRVSNGKSKDKKKGTEGKPKFEIRLAGDTVLAGAGRIVPFEVFGERPQGVGQIVALISSSHLPAPDDLPIIFLNVCKLFNAPLDDLKKLDITHLYTRWSLRDEVHDSQIFDIRSKLAEREINFNDHHAIPLKPQHVTQVTARFLDDYYEVQLRGMRSLSMDTRSPKLFGFEKHDRDYAKSVPRKTVEKETDFIIAKTRIDAVLLAKGISEFISSEYPLYPLRPSVTSPPHEQNCTNDINQIRAPLLPRLVVPTSLILSAQMTLEVSLGVVGCRPPTLNPCYSRFYCLISDSDSTLAILTKMWEINEECNDDIEKKLTGFALDTGNVVVIFIEGPKDGYILQIWDMTEELYPKVKPVFSTSARYATRIYGDSLQSFFPFIVLKMHVPLNIVLACPSVYARPALPTPCRIAALKLGRLVQNRYRTAPPCQELPTSDELKSFRLELCAPPRIFRPSLQAINNDSKLTPQKDEEKANATVSPAGSVSKINWQVYK